MDEILASPPDSTRPILATIDHYDAVWMHRCVEQTVDAPPWLLRFFHAVSADLHRVCPSVGEIPEDVPGLAR